MLKTVFSFELNHKILAAKVAVAKFDGTIPCLVAATLAEKVLWHCPQDRPVEQSGQSGRNFSSINQEVSILNVNQTILSLATGCLKKGSNEEFLVIGTPTSIFVYDVQNNRDLFYREIPDGANAVVVGQIGSNPEPLAIAGGNCAIQGFDSEAQDSYWTVTGDNITSLALFDVTADGRNELVVGSEDYDIRVFRDDAILYEMSETDVVTLLCGICAQTFGYALANGTVGVYHRQERIWRIKSKNRAVALASWDINGDGLPELITGWTSGKIDARSVETGEVVFKDTFGNAVAAIFICDYDMDGVEEMLVVSVEGEVRGYQRIGKEVRGDGTGSLTGSKREEEVLRDLMRKKQGLLVELRNCEDNGIDQQQGNSRRGSLQEEETRIPADTQIKSTLVLAPEDQPPAIHLSLSTSNDTIIRTAVIFAEGIFKGESFVVHPNDQEVESSVRVALRPEKDIPIDLHIKAIVGYTANSLFHVFELTRRLPKFSMYALVPGNVINCLPVGKVTFTLNEKIHRLMQWCQKSFLIQSESLPEAQEVFEFTFLCIRDSSLMQIVLKTPGNEFTISTDNIDLAGDIVQSLVADFLGYSELKSSAHFPKEIQTLKTLVQRVEEIQSVRQQLAADIAEKSAIVRSLLIKTEDARLLSRYKDMKKFFSEMNSVNRDLMNCYRIRQKNHEDLVCALKQINLLIQKTANLRVGKPKTELVQACRQAIKQNNLNYLSKIITSGEIS